MNMLHLIITKIAGSCMFIPTYANVIGFNPSYDEPRLK